MCREPPPVKHHTRERPTNLPRQRDLVFELPASGDRRTKSQCMCIPWFLHVRPALAVFPPLAIIHHAITHAACVSLLYSSSLELAPRLLHNQLILLCPKYLICINFITFIYLISTELINCESPGSYHIYQVHVYKISCGTQWLKWNIQWIERVNQWIVLTGEDSAHWRHLFIKSCLAYLAYFIM